MQDRITIEHLERYMDLTGKALDRLIVSAPKRSFGRLLAEDFLGMAKSYYSDARHFMEKEDFVNAFACINYSHGWLDCGARMGLFEVGEDDQLFTLFE